MLAHTKPTLPGYPITFAAGDFVSVHCRHRQAAMRDIRKVVGPKVMRVILSVYHDVKEDELEKTLRRVKVVRVILHEDTPKHWGQLIEILYRFTDEKGSYRHVFHFVSDAGGLSGRLFTQTKRHIAK